MRVKLNILIYTTSYKDLGNDVVTFCSVIKRSGNDLYIVLWDYTVYNFF